MENIKESIGFVGLGNMGKPMACNLLKAGYTLRVYNRDARKASALVAEGAHPCTHPGDVVSPGGIVINMVKDDTALEDVTLGEGGILEHLEPGGIHAVMSIISPSYTRKMTDLHTRRNCAYLAAPVFGGPDKAAAQKLWICLAGEPTSKERVHPILLHLGQGIFDFGTDPAIAPVVKICGNFLIASAMEGISQTLDLAEKNGLDRMTFVNMLTRSLFACSVYQDYGPMIAEEQDRFPPLWELLKGLTNLLDTK
jgi:3-hydroxyisobutyrate dehydrogenase-like beta-hydroxyacid dehydrogenase